MTDARTIRYREFAPSEELARLVACHWAFDVTAEQPRPFLHHVLPDGSVSLAYCPRGPEGTPWLVVIGPRPAGLRVPVFPGGAVWGVRFLPAAAGPILGVRTESLRETVRPLREVSAALHGELASTLAGCGDEAAAAGAFEEALAPLAPRGEAIDRLVERAAAELVDSHGEIRIAEVAARLGLSERQLQRRFRREVGLTPKEFARVRRLRAAARRRVPDPAEGWAGVAAVTGYTDQPHLIREFRELLGMTPGAYDRRLRLIRVEEYRY